MVPIFVVPYFSVSDSFVSRHESRTWLRIGHEGGENTGEKQKLIPTSLHIGSVAQSGALVARPQKFAGGGFHFQADS